MSSNVSSEFNPSAEQHKIEQIDDETLKRNQSVTSRSLSDETPNKKVVKDRSDETPTASPKRENVCLFYKMCRK